MPLDQQLTAMEERVASENDFLIAILHVPADAVLGVAGSVKCLDGDATDLQIFAVGRRLRHLVTVLAAKDWDRDAELLQLSQES